MHQEIDPTRAKPLLPISIANILNFKCGNSSNSVIPAPAYARTGTTRVQIPYPDMDFLNKRSSENAKICFSDDLSHLSRTRPRKMLK